MVLVDLHRHMGQKRANHLVFVSLLQHWLKVHSQAQMAVASPTAYRRGQALNTNRFQAALAAITGKVVVGLHGGGEGWGSMGMGACLRWWSKSSYNEWECPRRCEGRQVRHTAPHLSLVNGSSRLKMFRRMPSRMHAFALTLSSRRLLLPGELVYWPKVEK